MLSQVQCDRMLEWQEEQVVLQKMPKSGKNRFVYINTAVFKSSGRYWNQRSEVRIHTLAILFIIMSIENCIENKGKKRQGIVNFKYEVIVGIVGHIIWCMNISGLLAGLVWQAQVFNSISVALTEHIL